MIATATPESAWTRIEGVVDRHPLRGWLATWILLTLVQAAMGWAYGEVVDSWPVPELVVAAGAACSVVLILWWTIPRLSSGVARLRPVMYALALVAMTAINVERAVDAFPRHSAALDVQRCLHAADIRVDSSLAQSDFVGGATASDPLVAAILGSGETAPVNFPAFDGRPDEPLIITNRTTTPVETAWLEACQRGEL